MNNYISVIHVHQFNFMLINSTVNQFQFGFTLRSHAASECAGKAATLSCQLEIFGSQSALIAKLKESSQKILDARANLMNMTRPLTFAEINLQLSQDRC